MLQLHRNAQKNIFLSLFLSFLKNKVKTLIELMAIKAARIRL